MTTIHFHYTDSYNNPSRGSLAFMPHRRHAANETEVLPKPFTIPLLNGEVTVNLQPNSSSWVWIVTEYFEGISKSFYTTIPDRDGVLEHTELVHISPSSIPAPYDAVEPAWWAEMRTYKQTVTDTLLESGEALTEAKNAIEIGKESIERTQHNASLAKAYAQESREDSYKSRDYRDEAEQWRNEAKEQADRAASGPESAAQRAEDAANNASNSESAARGFRDEARDSASDARSSETSASGSASTATERASDARNEANRAESEANRAQGYADELMAGPRDYVEQAETARDEAVAAATTSTSSRDIAVTARDEAVEAQNSSERAATTSQEYAELSQTYAEEQRTTWQEQFSEWIEPSMTNGYMSRESDPVMWRETPLGVQLRGTIDASENTSATGQMFRVSPQRELPATYRWPISVFPYGRDLTYIDCQSSGRIGVTHADSEGYNTIFLSGIIPFVD